MSHRKIIQDSSFIYGTLKILIKKKIKIKKSSLFSRFVHFN